MIGRCKWIIVIYALITLVFYGIMIRPDYATDTYANIYMSKSDVVGAFLGSGRPFTMLFFLLSKLLHLDVKIVCLISFAIAILATTVAMVVLDRLYKKFISSNILRLAVTVTTIINPFTVEMFLFLEKGMMMSSVMFAVIAAWYLTRWMAGRNRRDILLSILMLCLSACCYQGGVGLFAVVSMIAMLATFMKEPRLCLRMRSYAQTMSIGAVVYFAGCLSSLLVAKVSSTLLHVASRTNGGINFGEQTRKLLGGIAQMVHMYDIVSARFLVVAILGLVVVTIIGLRLKRNRRNIPRYIIAIIFISLVCFVAAVAPQVVISSNFIWFAPRSTYSYGALFGAVMAVSLLYGGQGKPKPVVDCLMLGAAGLWMVYLFFNNNTILTDHYVMIKNDLARSQQIDAVLQDMYPGASNTRVMVANDGYPDKIYKDLFTAVDINASAFSTRWSYITAINYWNNRQYIEIKTSDWFSSYCAAHDWKDFQDGQIKDLGNGTVGICAYGTYAH